MSNFNSHSFWENVQKYDEQIRSVFITENVVSNTIQGIPSKEEKAVCDFGCGIGNSFKYLDDFKRIYAVDFSKNMLSKAQDKANHNLILVHSNIEDVKLPEKYDVALAISSIWPNDLPHFYRMFNNIMSQGNNSARILIVFPSLESKTFYYQIKTDYLSNNGMDAADLACNLSNELTKHQYNPLGYMYAEGGLLQKQWLKEEIYFRLQKFNFKKISIEKLELDWTVQCHTPQYSAYPRLWLWFVDILI